MQDNASMNRNIETFAWGALFVWWGVTLLVKLPPGVGLIGVAFILLGANAARYFQGIHINGFSACIGVLALIWGALELAGTALPFDLPVFAILLIALGATIVGLEFLHPSSNARANR